MQPGSARLHTVGFVVAVLGATPASPAGSPITTVSMVDNAYEPRMPTVPVGTPVAFANAGAEPHTATALDGSFDTGQVNAGERATITIAEPGVHRMFCRFHPEMTGRVTALEPPAPSAASPPGVAANGGFAAATLAIAAMVFVAAVVLGAWLASRGRRR